MTAHDIMQSNPRTVPRAFGAWSALALMRQEDIRHLLVEERGKLIGVLSNRDYRRILERMRPDGSVRGIPKIMVEEIMTGADRLFTASPEAPVGRLAELIVTKHVGCVPITDATDRIVGLVTQKAVLGAFLKSSRPEPERVRDSFPPDTGFLGR